MEPDQIFNLCEGLLWIAIACVLASQACKNKTHRSLKIGASLSFLLFGISDFIEMHTRAWFTPWALFALKAACVISLVAHLAYYTKTKRKNLEPPQ